ncbi:MAG: hypothetical protein LBM61_06480, partial [Prevotellaceae bacterium]|nr:hypothetical protein [Prevotellaceae bacterium]
TAAVPDSLSECEALDAFFGSSLGVEKTADNLVLDPVTLTRPFARINLIQKTLSLLADVRAVGLSYEETNQVFNIQTGEVKIADEVKDTLTITNNGEAFQTAEGGIFAYVYLFAPLVVDAQTELAMNLSFYRDEAATEEISKRTIPAGQPYARNYVTNLSGNYLDPEGTLEVNMDTEDYEVLEVFAVWDGVYPDVQYPDDPQAGAEATLLTAKISEGVYDITTADQLDCMAWLINESIGDYSTYTYNLKVNIDLDGESENPVKHWTPIGNNVETLFAGTFDGQGHVVKNMNVSVTIETSGNNAGGFFGGITGNAFIQYLQVEGDVSIVCDEPIPVGGKIGIAGGITGALLGGGSVAYCSFTGGLSVTASDSETEVATGGITGYLYFTKGPILNCIASLTSLSINSESTDLYSGVLVGGGAVPIAYCAWLPYSNLPDIGVGVGDEFVFSMSDPENMNELLENLDAANGVNSLDYSEVEALIKQELEPEFEWTFTPTFKWVDKDGTLRLQAR